MKSEYDFSKMKSRKNPYASKLKKSVTIRLGEDVIEHFKNMSEESGIPYQSLINLYLRDCANHHRKLDISWRPLAAVSMTPTDRSGLRVWPGRGLRQITRPVSYIIEAENLYANAVFMLAFPYNDSRTHCYD